MLCQLPHTYTLLSYIGQYLEYLPVVCHHEVKREKKVGKLTAYRPSLYV
jgi:hypothetical protein